jgi:putative ABC transport system substrate-binding protein
MKRREFITLLGGGAVPWPLPLSAQQPALPIVFLIGSDSVKFGLVASIARPGSNVTGVTLFTSLL